MTELSVKDAQDALYAAQERWHVLKSELDAVSMQVQHRREDLHQAKLRADSVLPAARMVLVMWRGERQCEKVVIVKRTPEQIVARRPGTDIEFVFRLIGSEWQEYPKEKGRFSTSITLEIAE